MQTYFFDRKRQREDMIFECVAQIILNNYGDHYGNFIGVCQLIIIGGQWIKNSPFWSWSKISRKSFIFFMISSLIERSFKVLTVNNKSALVNLVRHLKVMINVILTFAILFLAVRFSTRRKTMMHIFRCI